MKVIGITGNYRQEEATPSRCYLMADSSVLNTGRPFFLPDFAREFVAVPSIVVRTGRLGKFIAPKFASRYWNAITAGFTVQAVNGDDDRMGALDRAFDGAAIVGEWVPTDTLNAPTLTNVELMVNEEPVARCCLDDMSYPIDNLLADISKRCSIKMGDLLFTGDAGLRHRLEPADRLTAVIDGRKVLDVKIRL